MKWHEIFPKMLRITKFGAGCVEVERRFFFRTKETLRFSEGQVIYRNFQKPDESFTRALTNDDLLVLVEGLPKKGGRLVQLFITLSESHLGNFYLSTFPRISTDEEISSLRKREIAWNTFAEYSGLKKVDQRILT